MIQTTVESLINHHNIFSNGCVIWMCRCASAKELLFFVITKGHNFSSVSRTTEHTRTEQHRGSLPPSSTNNGFTTISTEGGAHKHHVLSKTSRIFEQIYHFFQLNRHLWLLKMQYFILYNTRFISLYDCTIGACNHSLHICSHELIAPDLLNKSESVSFSTEVKLTETSALCCHRKIWSRAFVWCPKKRRDFTIWKNSAKPWRRCYKPFIEIPFGIVILYASGCRY